MHVTLTKTVVNLGPQEYEIHIPQIDLNHLYTVKCGEKKAVIFGNKMDLDVLSCLLRFFSSRKEAILFIQTKQNELPDYLKCSWSIKEQSNGKYDGCSLCLDFYDKTLWGY